MSIPQQSQTKFTVEDLLCGYRAVQAGLLEPGHAFNYVLHETPPKVTTQTKSLYFPSKLTLYNDEGAPIREILRPTLSSPLLPLFCGVKPPGGADSSVVPAYLQMVFCSATDLQKSQWAVTSPEKLPAVRSALDDFMLAMQYLTAEYEAAAARLMQERTCPPAVKINGWLQSVRNANDKDVGVKLMSKIALDNPLFRVRLPMVNGVMLRKGFQKKEDRDAGKPTPTVQYVFDMSHRVGNKPVAVQVNGADMSVDTATQFFTMYSLVVFSMRITEFIWSTQGISLGQEMQMVSVYRHPPGVQAVVVEDEDAYALAASFGAAAAITAEDSVVARKSSAASEYKTAVYEADDTPAPPARNARAVTKVSAAAAIAAATTAESDDETDVDATDAGTDEDDEEEGVEVLPPVLPPPRATGRAPAKTPMRPRAK